jgi:hypothetical protein
VREGALYAAEYTQAEGSTRRQVFWFEPVGDVPMPRVKALPPKKTASPPPKKRIKVPLAERPLPVEVLALRPQHAATALGISVRTTWDWVKAGKLQVVRPSPGIVLVLVSSIRKLLEPAPPAE